MNKNTKRRLLQMKKDGQLVKYVSKPKAKPFPKPHGEDNAMTLADQREFLYGKR